MSVLEHLQQCFFIAKPTLTEKNLPSQAGRVFIITGGYTGVGFELAKILYQHNGTVYLAARSQTKYDAAHAAITKAHPSSDGRLEFLKLDLSDLPTIRASADAFLAKEARLDVLTNNAGVMTPPVGSKTAQGYEQQFGTNVTGHWLFTHYLTPILKKTAASSPKGSVRVTWAASLATAFAVKHGLAWENDAPKSHNNAMRDYAQSKASNYLLAKEFQARFGKDGLVSAAWNPGNLSSELQRHRNFIENFFLKFILYEPVYGAYTELYAGWSEEVAEDRNIGKYIVPWGRVGNIRRDLEKSQEGPKLWAWCEKELKAYL